MVMARVDAVLDCAAMILLWCPGSKLPRFENRGIGRRTGWAMAGSRRIEETDAGCLSLAVGSVVDLAREST